MRKAILMFFLTGIFLSKSILGQEFKEDRKFEKISRFTNDKQIILLKSRPVEFKKEDYNTAFPKETRRIYLKLKNPPDKSTLLKLIKQGITLKEYLADNTYVVELTRNRLDKLKKTFFVDGFANVEPEDKITERLYRKNIPSYAREGNYVKVDVAFYADVTLNDALAQVRSAGGTIEKEHFSRTHKLRVSIHQLNIMKLAELDIVKYIEEIPPPKTNVNIDSGKLSNIFWDNDGNTISGLFDKDYNDGSVYYLKGSGINIAVKDGSYAYNHSDFENRLHIIDNDLRPNDNYLKILDMLHTTHVSGTIGAKLSINDMDNDTGGIAELINIYSYNYNYDLNEYETDIATDYVNAIANFSASISNNSWGSEITQNNKYLLGDYSSTSEDLDDFVYDYYDSNALVIKASGNYRDVFTDNDGYFTLPDDSCAKNIVTVGSVGINEADNEISDFSSSGPTNDGRIKPEVVADGYKLVSTIFDYSGGNYTDAYSDCDNHPLWFHQRLSGTSMASPVVTGICALIHEAYKDVHAVFPTADIVKALLINYAEDLGMPGPDFAYGFGLVNAKACIDAIYNLDASDGGHIIKGEIGVTGDFMEYQIDVFENVNDSQPVTLSLVWIDPAGNPSALNSIVNDLDFFVSHSKKDHFPFYFRKYDTVGQPVSVVYTADPAQPAMNDGIYNNRYDTAEQIVIPLENDGKLSSGKYTIRVNGERISLLNQPFVIVSSIGFNGFHFNTLKVKNAEGIWISNQFAVLDKNPDVLLMVTELENEGFNPSSVEYSYSTDAGNTWSAWDSVTGVYKDENCTQVCSNPCTGVAYIKKENVPFNKVSIYENRVKFRLTYKGQPLECPEQYIIKNNNIYYVSTTNGDDDNEGIGTEIYPWKTIGHAISSAVATEEVPAIIRVQKGTYNEDVVMNRYVHLYGGYSMNWNRDLENNETIIQGTGTTHVVEGDNESTLDGFTVTGGNAYYGGGIFICGESPSIMNCVIKDNIAHYGAGIYIESGSPNIMNCTIKNNVLTQKNSGEYPRGGGLFVANSSGILKKCKISNNTTDSVPYIYKMGIGLYIEDCALIIEECLFESNSPSEIPANYLGGGICFFSDSQSIVLNSIFKSNSVDGGSYNYGGGIFAWSCSLKILGCLFYLNNASSKGGAIYCDFSTMTITNCTIYNNSSSNTGGIYRNGTSPCTITNCIIWNNGDDLYNATATYSCIEDNDAGTGNIHVEPLFVEADNENFRLCYNSPCINSGIGSATSLDLLKKDINGDQRILCGGVDMGADEYKWKATSISLDSQNNEVAIEWDSLEDVTYYVEYCDFMQYIAVPQLQYRMNDNDSTPVVIENCKGLNGTFRILSGGNFYNRNTALNAVAGKIGSALYFDQNCVLCGNVGNIKLDISIAAWVKLENCANIRTLVAKDSLRSYKLTVETDGNLGFFINDGVSSETIKTTSLNFPLNEWVHVTVTADFSYHEIKFYINGNCFQTKPFTKNFIKVTSGQLIIGAKNDIMHEAWKGIIDDLRLYNVVLSQDDIAIIYNGGSGIEDEKGAQWTRITPGIEGQDGTTSWVDDGSQAPALLDSDNDGILHRYYRVVYEY